LSFDTSSNKNNKKTSGRHPRPGLRVKEINQRFTTILKKFHPEDKPTQELQIEVYINALPSSNSIFEKRASKPTLAENFEEAKTIEFQMKGCKEG
jgi:hypothetical protein